MVMWDNGDLKMRKLFHNKVFQYEPCKRTVTFVNFGYDKTVCMQFPYMLFWVKQSGLCLAYCTEAYKKNVTLWSPVIPNLIGIYDVCLGDYIARGLKAKIELFWETKFQYELWHAHLSL